MCGEPDIEGKSAPAKAGMVSVRMLTLWTAGLCFCALIASIALVFSGQKKGGYFVIVCAYALAAAAATCDTALRSVPNRLTYPALLTALAINLAVSPLLTAVGADSALIWLGAPGWKEALLGLALCAGVGLLSFVTRGLGGGDVKLLGALGALVGLGAIIPILVNTLAVAAVVGLVNLAVRGVLVRRLQVLFLYVYGMMITRRIEMPQTFSRTESPFCLSLLLGMILLPLVNLHQLIWSYVRGM